MTNQLSYYPVLSLKEIAVRKVVVSLWSNPDILASIEKFTPVFEKNYWDYSEKWHKTIESKVRGAMTKFILPETLIKLALSTITPVGLQIKKWKGFHEHYLLKPEALNSRIYQWDQFGARILEKLCFTMAGTINYRQTAENLMRYKRMNVVKRYRLACLYCLDDWIPVLWKELPENNKMEFYNAKKSRLRKLNLEFCWPYILKGQQSKLDSMIRREFGNGYTFNRIAFEFSACSGNKPAAKYFYQMLMTREERKASLYRAAELAIQSRTLTGYKSKNNLPSENYCDVMCYLLSHMNQEQQTEFFKSMPARVLCCFMNWPWQNLFLKILDLIWANIPAENYYKLLMLIRDYLSESHYYFLVMFQEFFIRSPNKFKKGFVDQECRFGLFFHEFIRVEDTETVKIVLRNIDSVDRVRLVTSSKMFEIFYCAITEDKLHIVGEYIRGATLCQRDRQRLKESFFIYFVIADLGGFSKSDPKEFIQLMDEIERDAQSKRFLEDKTLNNAKRLCYEK